MVHSLTLNVIDEQDFRDENYDFFKAHLTEDGNFFYCYKKRNEKTPRIYMLYRGKEIDAKLLPGFDVSKPLVMHSQGSAVYFSDQGTIYKAEPILSGNTMEMKVTEVRDLKKGESVETGICTRVCGENKFVYRMGDDHEKKAFRVNETNRGDRVLGIHKGKTVYCKDLSEDRDIFFGGCDESGICVGLHNGSMFANDSSSFIYFMTHRRGVKILVLDTENWRFKSELCVNIDQKGDPGTSFVGVHNGLLYFLIHSYRNILACVQLPKGYYDSNYKTNTAALLEKSEMYSTEMQKNESMQKKMEIMEIKIESALKEWSNEMEKLAIKCTEAEKKALTVDNFIMEQEIIKERLDEIEAENLKLKAELEKEKKRKAKPVPMGSPMKEVESMQYNIESVLSEWTTEKAELSQRCMEAEMKESAERRRADLLQQRLIEVEEKAKRLEMEALKSKLQRGNGRSPVQLSSRWTTDDEDFPPPPFGLKTGDYLESEMRKTSRVASPASSASSLRPPISHKPLPAALPKYAGTTSSRPIDARSNLLASIRAGTKLKNNVAVDRDEAAATDEGSKSVADILKNSRMFDRVRSAHKREEETEEEADECNDWEDCLSS